MNQLWYASAPLAIEMPSRPVWIHGQQFKYNVSGIDNGYTVQTATFSAGSPLNPDEVLPQLIAHSHIKAQEYSAAEWENIRPRFTALYLSTDLKLRDIVQKLSLEHGFHAR